MRLLIVCLFVCLMGCAADQPARRVDFGVGAAPEVAKPGKILVLLTAAKTQPLADGSTRETGYFLNELYEPYQALKAQGYEPVLATLDGAAPALDPESLALSYWGDDEAALARAKAWAASLKVELRADEALGRVDLFQGMIVPGGQGVMVDLFGAQAASALILAFGRQDKPVGLICHAPALLLKLPPRDNPFAGALVTSVSATEEWYIERMVMGAKAKDRAIGEQLQARGYRHEAAFPGRANAQADCGLVTSQNPFSGERFNVLYLEALAQHRRGGRCVRPAPQ